MQTAKSWGMSPSEFYRCSEDDQAFMIATVIAESQIQAWDTQQSIKERSSPAQKGRRAKSSA